MLIASDADATALQAALVRVREHRWDPAWTDRFAAADPVTGVGLAWDGWRVVGSRLWGAHREPGARRIEHVTVVLTHDGGFWAVTTVPTESLEVVANEHGEPMPVVVPWASWAPEDRCATVRECARDAVATPGGLEPFVAALAAARGEVLRDDPWAPTVFINAGLAVVLTDAVVDPMVVQVRMLAALSAYGDLGDLTASPGR